MKIDKYLLIFVGGLVAVSVALYIKAQNTERVTNAPQAQGVVSTGEKAPDFSLNN